MTKGSLEILQNNIFLMGITKLNFTCKSFSTNLNSTGNYVSYLLIPERDLSIYQLY